MNCQAAKSSPMSPLARLWLRELKEETGLELARIEQFVGSIDYFSKAGESTRQFNFIAQVSEYSGIRLSPSTTIMCGPVRVTWSSFQCPRRHEARCGHVSPELTSLCPPTVTSPPFLTPSFSLLSPCQIVMRIAFPNSHHTRQPLSPRKDANNRSPCLVPPNNRTQS